MDKIYKQKVLTFTLFFFELFILLIFNSPIIFANTYELKTIFPQTPYDYYFYDASAVAVDYQKFIYIADEKNNRIIKYTNDGRFIKQWGVKGSNEGQFDRVKDIVFDGNQSLYIVDSNNNRIQQFTLDGHFVNSWSGSDTDDSFSVPHSIIIDNNGYIYVADTFNNRIQKFTYSGDFISEWNYKKELNEPVGLASCSDEESDICLYVLESSGATSGRLLHVLADKNFYDCSVEVLFDVNTSESDSEGYTQQEYNAHISTDSNGFIYIPDKKIFIVDPVKKTKDVWGDYGDAIDQFQRPVGIKIVQDEIYVTDWDKDCVRKFSIHGELLNYWGFKGDEPDQLNFPYGLVYHNGLIYVADTGNNIIKIYNHYGHFNKIIGKDLNKPTDIVCHSDGTIYIADQKNKRIQSVNSQGIVNNFDCSGFPDRIDIDSFGNLYVSYYIYVSDRKKYQIEKVNLESTYSTVFTCDLPDSYSLDTLQDIAVTHNGYTIYAIFQGRNEILQFNKEGVCLDNWIPGKNQSLAAISVDLTNNIFLEYSDTIKKYSPIKKEITSFNALKLDQKRLGIDTRRGLCVSNDNVFLTDDYSRIQVYGSKTNIVNKAIIVAGSAHNTLWDLIQLQANMAYQTLIKQQWKKENIKYLSSDINIDLDSNGKADDVDEKPTLTNLKKAVIDWSKNADSLVIYMVGYGGINKFRLNDESIPYTYTSDIELTQYENILYSDELDKWLDELQRTNSNLKIVIIYDADYSGSFISNLQSENRIIISSTSQNQTAAFPDTASLSFSSIFWKSIYQQKTIKKAFLEASKIFIDLGLNQSPLIDSNANNNFCDDSDLQEADIQLNQKSVENDYSQSNEIPIIGDNIEWNFSSDQSLLTITANQITSTKRINRVFGVLLPQNSENIAVDYPIIEFKRSNENMNQGNYSGSYIIDHSGEYRVVIYARNSMFALSEPQILTIPVSISKKTKAIIIVGNTESTQIQSCYDANATIAYDALIYKGYEDEDIYLLSNSNIANVDDPLTYENIYNYFESINNTNTKEILIYVIGEGDYKSFHLNKTNELKASEMNQWIDSSIDIILIYDACMGKSFIQEFSMNSEQSNRILIASSQLIEPAYCLFQESISFSRFFWSQVNNGLSTNSSFQYANNNLKKLDIAQNAIIFDQNQVSPYHYIGYGIKQMPDLPITGKASAILKKNQLFLETINVSTTNLINKVFAFIIPVDKHLSYLNELNTKCPISCMPVKEILLTSHADNKFYSASAITDLNNSGEYNVHFFSMDNNGMLSTIETKSIYQNNNEDFYEPDNQEATANIININDPEPQQHSLHEKSDFDIFKFMGSQNKIYEIKVINVKQFQEFYIVVEIYNGEKWNVLKQGLLPIKKEWKCPEDSEYLVKVRFNENQNFNEACGYYVSIDEKDADFSALRIVGKIFDKYTNDPINEIKIQSEKCISTMSEKEGVFGMYCSENYGKNVTLTFTSNNYQKVEYIFTPKDSSEYIELFMKPLYTITASISSCCGYISPGGETQISYDETQIYRITPRDCSLLHDVMIDNVSHGPILMYTFSNVNKDHEIEVFFKKYKYYSIANLISMMKTLSGEVDKPICQQYKMIIKFEDISDIIEVMKYLASH